MNAVLEKAVELRAVTREFNDSVALFCENDPLPYAVRAPREDSSYPQEPSFGEILFEDMGFSILKCKNHIHLTFNNGCSHRAVIKTPSEADARSTADNIIRFLTDGRASILPTRYDTENYLSVCNSVAAVADYFGCLTDINPPSEGSTSRFDRVASANNAGVMLFALGAVCLIYRKISALRGFNFKLILEDDAVCFAFSARIIGEGICDINDIPGYRALRDLDSGKKITLYTRLAETDGQSDTQLYRLTVILTPQIEDPSGKLRAPEWKETVLKRFDKLEAEIIGRF
jgi:hypothetical protein